MTKFYQHPKAVAERDATWRSIIRAFGAHLITLEQAQRLGWEAARKLAADSYTDDGSGNYPIQCYGCGRVEVVSEDVLTYKCPCSPNTERYTFKSRQIDIPIGAKRGLESLVAENKGRQTI